MGSANPAWIWSLSAQRKDDLDEKVYVSFIYLTVRAFIDNRVPVQRWAFGRAREPNYFG